MQEYGTITLQSHECELWLFVIAKLQQPNRQATPPDFVAPVLKHHHINM